MQTQTVRGSCWFQAELCFAEAAAEANSPIYSIKGEAWSNSQMAYARSAPGIIAWKGEVLVFGSYLGSGTQKCERLDLVCKQWTALPDLHKARSYFTPEEWRGAVYLCGGYCLSIERFDGVSMHLCQSYCLKALEH